MQEMSKWGIIETFYNVRRCVNGVLLKRFIMQEMSKWGIIETFYNVEDV